MHGVSSDVAGCGSQYHKAGVFLLVGGARSWGSWLRAPRTPRASVGLLMVRAGSLGVPELLPAAGG